MGSTTVKKSAEPHNLNRFEETVDYAEPQVASKEYLREDGSIAFDKGIINGFKDSKFERITLKIGTRIMRYGNEGGHFAARAGTPYSELALPYKIATCIYNEYEVVQSGIVVDRIKVHYGIASKQPAWPSERGGGEQYFFPEPEKGVVQYVDRGLRRLEVSEWTSVLKEDLTHV